MLQNANLADWCGSIYAGLFVRRRHREKEKKKTEETKSNKEKQVKITYNYTSTTKAQVLFWLSAEVYRYIPIFNQHQK